MFFVVPTVFLGLPKGVAEFMNTTTEQIFIDALSLSVSARATLVHKLLLSLESEEGSLEIEAVWKREVLDRCQAFDEGQLTERDAADVLREAHQKLG